MIWSILAQTIDIAGPLPQVTDNALQNIVNVVFAVTAAIAVLIIVIAGVKFIWSRGDPQATVKARNAIVYAGIGLIVVSVAFSITTFVLNVL